MEEKTDMVTVAEATDMLGIGRTTLFTTYIKTGRLQPANRTRLLKRPRRLLFRRSDVERLRDEAPAE